MVLGLSPWYSKSIRFRRVGYIWFWCVGIVRIVLGVCLGILGSLSCLSNFPCKNNGWFGYLYSSIRTFMNVRNPIIPVIKSRVNSIIKIIVKYVSSGVMGIFLPLCSVLFSYGS